MSEGDPSDTGEAPVPSRPTISDTVELAAGLRSRKSPQDVDQLVQTMPTAPWADDYDLAASAITGVPAITRLVVPPDYQQRLAAYRRHPVYCARVYGLQFLDPAIRPHLYACALRGRRSPLDRPDLRAATGRREIEKILTEITRYPVELPADADPRAYLLASLSTVPWVARPPGGLPWSAFGFRYVPPAGPEPRAVLAQPGNDLDYGSRPTLAWHRRRLYRVDPGGRVTAIDRVPAAAFAVQEMAEVASRAVDLAPIAAREERRLGEYEVRVREPFLPWPRDVPAGWRREVERTLAADERRLELIYLFSWGYDRLANQAARSGRATTRTAAVVGALLAVLDHVPPLPRPLTLYRGVKENPTRRVRFFSRLRPGDRLDDYGFASKSYLPETAEYFASQDSSCCFLEVRYPAGHRLLFMPPVASYYFGEVEFVTRPGEVFRVASNELRRFRGKERRVIALDYDGDGDDGSGLAGLEVTSDRPYREAVEAAVGRALGGDPRAANELLRWDRRPYLDWAKVTGIA